MRTSHPDARATSAAASSDCAGAAITSLRVRASRGSPGGTTPDPCASAAVTRAGTATRQRSSTARASAGVDPSPTVGPDPIIAGSSPGTSEIIRHSTRAGQAAAASWPPLTRLRCLRTRLIRSIGAPLARSAAFTCALSASVIPGAGATSRADAPPDTRTSTRSPSPAPRTSASIRSVARSPAASGTGWAASTTSMRRVGRAWP